MEHGIRIRTIVLHWLILLSVSSLQSQSAGNIDNLSQWRVTASYFNGYEEVTYEFKYYISGSITIDSLEYYEVYMSGYSYVNPSDLYYFNHLYAGALREYENKWYKLGYNNVDALLYDFTLNIGDSMYGGMITIIDIDTVMVDGVPKKRFHLDGAGWGNEEFIIEDIGATTGLFEEMIFFENVSHLYCYAIDFVPLWINPYNPYCDLSVKIEENISNNSVSSYPNPFTTSTAIKFELDGKSKIQISIFNTMGEIVYQQEGDYDQGTRQFSWSPHHLPTGLYFGVFQFDENVEVIKMLKQ